MRSIRLSLTILISLSILSVLGQTQRGYVKTKGRVVNGVHVPGQGLPGATVSIYGGRNVAVQKQDGSFSFPVPSKTFLVVSVKKKGYELVDADVTLKSYQCSSNPFYLVMETPEQQMEDLLEAEEKITKTLRQQLQISRQEIQRLREDNKITEEDYCQKIAELMEKQKNSKDLIADMAKEYAKIDYDQMSEINRSISEAILSGRLLEADSLLRSKGDINTRIAHNKKKLQAEIKEREELEKRHEKLEKSIVGTQKEKEDIASDCYNFYKRFKLSNQYDSAAYYIELRAELDSQMPMWQIEAASFFNEQRNYMKAEKYSKKVLEVSNQLVKSDPHTYKMYITWAKGVLGCVYYSLGKQQEAITLFKDFIPNANKLADSYAGFHSKQWEWLYLYFYCLINSDMEREEKEKMLTKALGICDSLDNANSLNFMATSATCIQLAFLYSDLQQVEKAEAMFKSALNSSRKAAEKNKECENNVSEVLRLYADFYSRNLHFKEAEAMYLEALEIDRRLAFVNSSKHEASLAKDYNGLACVYALIGKTQECETLFQKAAAIYRHLVNQDSSLYESELANILNNLGGLYCILHRYKESEEMLNESLKICRILANNKNQKYKSYLAKTLYMFARLYREKGQFTESESMYNEALEIRRQLAGDDSLGYEADIAQTLYDLGLLKFSMERFEEAFPPLEEALDVYRRIFKANLLQREGYVNTLRLLGMLYTSKNKEKACSLYEECIPLMKDYYFNNPEQWKSGYAEVLGNQSYVCLFMKRFVQSEKYAREGLLVDSTQLFIYSNLAPALLLQGKILEAEKIYGQFKNELKESFFYDFKQFAEVGLIPKKREKDVKRIKELLNK